MRLSLDPIVVTASRNAETAFDAPRSVSVVERKDIEASPALSVIDRIASLPGVETTVRPYKDAPVTAL